MNNNHPPAGATPARIKAYLVHLYTASTTVVLLLSTLFLLEGQLTAALFALLFCIVIDGTDGILARRYNVKKHVPEVDGRAMDDVIDFVAYAFLPVLFMVKAEMLLDPVLFFGSLPLLASAFGFARVNIKLDDEGFFVGFPSYWNLLVAYLYLVSAPPWFNTIAVIVLAILVFVPTRYIYITRFPHHRNLHLAAAVVSGIMLLGAIVVGGTARIPLVLISLIYPLFYVIYSLRLDRAARSG
ncbi:MAG: CDP-diacylglycerol O-phosphatidyltransferase [Candidatus Viridilinea halotolerans]|uniref:CDP-diacylglycerol O-phosphatidyltransferase n=1 Tax=Candidatus Viridilinea halotolerans TaxID=2491704 RepID=A0A426U9N4_9CHLR|nr:MAG: CDP-diacylglycerol O-phosphatidyltransferase [Candidatus Viridilinea halotolerans]